MKKYLDLTKTKKSLSQISREFKDDSWISDYLKKNFPAFDRDDISIIRYHLGSIIPLFVEINKNKSNRITSSDMMRYIQKGYESKTYKNSRAAELITEDLLFNIVAEVAEAPPEAIMEEAAEAPPEVVPEVIPKVPPEVVPEAIMDIPSDRTLDLFIVEMNKVKSAPPISKKKVKIPEIVNIKENFEKEEKEEERNMVLSEQRQVNRYNADLIKLVSVNKNMSDIARNQIKSLKIIEQNRKFEEKSLEKIDKKSDYKRSQVEYDERIRMEKAYNNQTVSEDILKNIRPNLTKFGPAIVLVDVSDRIVADFNAVKKKKQKISYKDYPIIIENALAKTKEKYPATYKKYVAPNEAELKNSKWLEKAVPIDKLEKQEPLHEKQEKKRNSSLQAMSDANNWMQGIEVKQREQTNKEKLAASREAESMRTAEGRDAYRIRSYEDIAKNEQNRMIKAEEADKKKFNEIEDERKFLKKEMTIVYNRQKKDIKNKKSFYDTKFRNEVLNTPNSFESWAKGIIPNEKTKLKRKHFDLLFYPVRRVSRIVIDDPLISKEGLKSLTEKIIVSDMEKENPKNYKKLDYARDSLIESNLIEKLVTEILHPYNSEQGRMKEAEASQIGRANTDENVREFNEKKMLAAELHQKDFMAKEEKERRQSRSAMNVAYNNQYTREIKRHEYFKGISKKPDYYLEIKYLETFPNANSVELKNAAKNFPLKKVLDILVENKQDTKDVFVEKARKEIAPVIGPLLQGSSLFMSDKKRRERSYANYLYDRTLLENLATVDPSLIEPEPTRAIPAKLIKTEAAKEPVKTVPVEILPAKTPVKRAIPAKLIKTEAVKKPIKTEPKRQNREAIFFEKLMTRAEANQKDFNEKVKKDAFREEGNLSKHDPLIKSEISKLYVDDLEIFTLNRQIKKYDDEEKNMDWDYDYFVSSNSIPQFRAILKDRIYGRITPLKTKLHFSYNSRNSAIGWFYITAQGIKLTDRIQGTDYWNSMDITNVPHIHPNYPYAEHLPHVWEYHRAAWGMNYNFMLTTTRDELARRWKETGIPNFFQEMVEKPDMSIDNIHGFITNRVQQISDEHNKLNPSIKSQPLHIWRDLTEAFNQIFAFTPYWNITKDVFVPDFYKALPLFIQTIKNDANREVVEFIDDYRKDKKRKKKDNEKRIKLYHQNTLDNFKKISSYFSRLIVSQEKFLGKDLAIDASKEVLDKIISNEKSKLQESMFANKEVNYKSMLVDIEKLNKQGIDTISEFSTESPIGASSEYNNYVHPLIGHHFGNQTRGHYGWDGVSWPARFIFPRSITMASISIHPHLEREDRTLREAGELFKKAGELIDRMERLKENEEALIFQEKSFKIITENLNTAFANAVIAAEAYLEDEQVKAKANKLIAKDKKPITVENLVDQIYASDAAVKREQGSSTSKEDLGQLSSYVESVSVANDLKYFPHAVEYIEALLGNITALPAIFRKEVENDVAEVKGFLRVAKYMPFYEYKHLIPSGSVQRMMDFDKKSLVEHVERIPEDKKKETTDILNQHALVLHEQDSLATIMKSDEMALEKIGPLTPIIYEGKLKGVVAGEERGLTLNKNRLDDKKEEGETLATYAFEYFMSTMEEKEREKSKHKPFIEALKLLELDRLELESMPFRKEAISRHYILYDNSPNLNQARDNELAKLNEKEKIVKESYESKSKKIDQPLRRFFLNDTKFKNFMREKKYNFIDIEKSNAAPIINFYEKETSMSSVERQAAIQRNINARIFAEAFEDMNDTDEWREVDLNELPPREDASGNAVVFDEEGNITNDKKGFYSNYQRSLLSNLLDERTNAAGRHFAENVLLGNAVEGAGPMRVISPIPDIVLETKGAGIYPSMAKFQSRDVLKMEKLKPGEVGRFRSEFEDSVKKYHPQRGVHIELNSDADLNKLGKFRTDFNTSVITYNEKELARLSRLGREQLKRMKDYTSKTHNILLALTGSTEPEPKPETVSTEPEKRSELPKLEEKPKVSKKRFWYNPKDQTIKIARNQEQDKRRNLETQTKTDSVADIAAKVIIDKSMVDVADSNLYITEEEFKPVLISRDDAAFYMPSEMRRIYSERNMMSFLGVFRNLGSPIFMDKFTGKQLKKISHQMQLENIHRPKPRSQTVDVEENDFAEEGTKIQKRIVSPFLFPDLDEIRLAFRKFPTVSPYDENDDISAPIREKRKKDSAAKYLKISEFTKDLPGIIGKQKSAKKIREEQYTKNIMAKVIPRLPSLIGRSKTIEPKVIHHEDEDSPEVDIFMLRKPTFRGETPMPAPPKVRSGANIKFGINEDKEVYNPVVHRQAFRGETPTPIPPKVRSGANIKFGINEDKEIYRENLPRKVIKGGQIEKTEETRSRETNEFGMYSSALKQSDRLNMEKRLERHEQDRMENSEISRKRILREKTLEKNELSRMTNAYNRQMDVSIGVERNRRIELSEIAHNESTQIVRMEKKYFAKEEVSGSEGKSIYEKTPLLFKRQVIFEEPITEIVKRPYSPAHKTGESPDLSVSPTATDEVRAERPSVVKKGKEKKRVSSLIPPIAISGLVQYPQKDFYLNVLRPKAAMYPSELFPQNDFFHNIFNGG